MKSEPDRWEGPMLGRRVLTLSKTFYEAAGSMTKVVDPDKLNAAILKALAKPAVADVEARDRGLAWLIDAELQASFPMTREAIPDALDQLAQALSSSPNSVRNSCMTSSA